MRKLILAMSVLAMMLGVNACKGGDAQNILDAEKQEREFLRDAIRHRSPDVQRVDIIGNTLVYTHIFDGIIDEKTYTYDGDVCVEAERVYTFPTQMSALRHYRRAVERAELYDNIQLFNNQVKYDLKQQQHELETKGLTMPQLKEKFDKQISDAKADMHRHNEKIKADIKVGGQFIEDDMNCCKDKGVCKDKSNCKKK
jgi:hypothetical protein